MEAKIAPIHHLPFRPLPGLASPHAQTILASLSRAGRAPLSSHFLVSLDDGDSLCCEVSTPLDWSPSTKTVILIHGLGGSHISNYMVRISRKLYECGYRIVRVNLRGCGSGSSLARLPYHGGISNDILNVVLKLKQQTPHSPLILIGFSLGGNIILKLAGELGENANSLLHQTIAICPPIDLAKTVDLLSYSSNRLYQRYYLGRLQQHAHRWIKNQAIHSITDFDNAITAPQWGFQNATDYYSQCSSQIFIPKIRHPCHLLFAADDPFIDYRPTLTMSICPSVKIWLTDHGGHMGFLGWTDARHQYFWLDSLLQSWIHSG